MTSLTDIRLTKKHFWILTVAWTLSVGLSLCWNIKSFDRERENNALQSARSFFHLIVAATAWDIDTDRSYAPKGSADYSTHHLAKIETHENIELTHADPALMARLLSEITAQENGVSFRITSLKHSSLHNKASLWEKNALQSFEEGVSEYGAYIGVAERRYHYMAPLFTTENCLKCHEKQGYELGDIRGGISVILPLEKWHINWPLLASHSLAAVIGIIFFIFFMSQLGKAEEKMELLASRDSLTGVANRRFFQEYLQREWLRAKRNKTPLSLILCDMDFFKQYNSTYGHRAGDNCLSQVADTITSTLKRPGDFIARYGGVKFAIILPDTEIYGAETVAKIILKLIENLKIEHLPSTANKYITVSIGITDNATLSSSSEIMTDVNKALLQAKEEGRNRIICLHHNEEHSPA